MFWDFVRPFFEWSYNTLVAEWIRDSLWAFAILEVFHLLGLTILLGVMAVSGLRLLNLTMQQCPVQKLAREMAPWTALGLGLMVLSGVPMYMSEAIKCFNSGPFRIKMIFLFLAIIVHLTLYRKVTRPTGGHVNTRLSKLTGALTLTLWLGVAVAGRAIGFF